MHLIKYTIKLGFWNNLKYLTITKEILFLVILIAITSSVCFLVSLVSTILCYVYYFHLIIMQCNYPIYCAKLFQFLFQIICISYKLIYMLKYIIFYYSFHSFIFVKIVVNDWFFFFSSGRCRGLLVKFTVLIKQSLIQYLSFGIRITLNSGYLQLH